MNKKSGFIVLPALLALILIVGLVSLLGRSGVSGWDTTGTGTGTDAGSQSSTPDIEIPTIVFPEPEPEPEEYTLTVNLTGVTTGYEIPAKVGNTDTLTLIFVAEETYKLPIGITVTGAEYSWNGYTGALTLSQATGAVTVTIEAEHVYPYLEVGESADPRSRTINIYDGPTLILSKDANEPGFYHLDLTGDRAVTISCMGSSDKTYFIVYNGEMEIFKSTQKICEYIISSGTEWTHVYFIDDN